MIKKFFSLCHEVMQSITVLMQEKRPDLDGDFVTHRYALEQSNAVAEYLDISYYSPYYMNELHEMQRVVVIKYNYS